MYKMIASVITALVCAVTASEICETTCVSETEQPKEASAVSGTAQYENFYQLYESWYAEGYPDYVCGVYSLDGTMENLVVGITNDEKGEKGAQEILSLIENDSGVSFEYMKYTYAELQEVRLKVKAQLKEKTDSGLIFTWGVGISETQNAVVVTMDLSTREKQAFAMQCMESYGDMVVFENGGEIVAEGGTMISPGNNKPVQNAGRVDFIPEGEWWYTTAGEPLPQEGGLVDTIAITQEELLLPQEGELTATVTIAREEEPQIMILAAAAAALIILTGVGIFTLRRLRARQTDKGVIPEKGKLSRGQVRAIIKSAEEKPERDILSEILKDE